MEKNKNQKLYTNLDYWDQDEIKNKIYNYKKIKSIIDLLKDYEIDIKNEILKLEETEYDYIIDFKYIMLCGFKKTPQNKIYFTRLVKLFSKEC